MGFVFTCLYGISGFDTQTIHSNFQFIGLIFIFSIISYLFYIIINLITNLIKQKQSWIWIFIIVFFVIALFAFYIPFIRNHCSNQAKGIAISLWENKNNINNNGTTYNTSDYEGNYSKCMSKLGIGLIK